MKKIYTFLLIIIATLISSRLFLLDNNKVQNIENKIELKNNESIEDLIKIGSKISNKEQILIKSGNVCSWNIKDNVAYGLYGKKHLLPKIILENTEFTVKWITNKRVLLPGLVQTIDGKDTTICATANGKEFYIVIVSGENLKIVNKRNKIHYVGETKLSNLEDFYKIFNLKVQ